MFHPGCRLASVVLALLVAACGPPPPRDGGTDAAPDRPDAPDGAITAPPEAWTWVPFPGTACGNGTPAGLGVNLTSRSPRVLIYLAGGGACWDGPSCLEGRPLGAVHVRDSGPYTADELRREAAAIDASGLGDRRDPANPFRDASYVFVPYCTGDLHAGARVATYTAAGRTARVHHVGARNLDAFLAALAATFPATDRVWLMGSSAGGYGAFFNAGRVQAAFPRARVDVLGDSSPLLTPRGARRDALTAAWDLQLPPGCARCRERWEDLAAYWNAHLGPPHRHALLTYQNDLVVRVYLDYPLFGTAFADATEALLAESYLPPAPARHFALPGGWHVMLGQFRTLASPSGVRLRDWIRQWAEDDPAWQSVGP